MFQSFAMFGRTRAAVLDYVCFSVHYIFQQECSELPDDLAEIEAKIHESQARLECCGVTDPKVTTWFVHLRRYAENESRLA